MKSEKILVKQLKKYASQILVTAIIAEIFQPNSAAYEHFTSRGNGA